jgi:hypothetical protein
MDLGYFSLEFSCEIIYKLPLWKIGILSASGGVDHGSGSTDITAL